MQHRGGALGFVKVSGLHELAFADYKGKRQMLTTGNVTRTVHPPERSNPVIVFLMKPGWDFALFPTLTGAVIPVLDALLYHNVNREDKWPRYW